MSLGKQLGIVVLILLTVGAGGYWYASEYAGSDVADAAAGPKREPATVDVVVVEPRTLASRIEAVGTTLARQAVDITPSTAGRVTEIAFSAGNRVEVGETLAKLDDGAEQADVAEAEAERRKAELALQRANKLVATKNIAQATLDELEAGYRAAEARLLRAEKQLADRTIKAPFAGQVGLKQVDVGAQVDDGTVITTLDDLAQIQVDFSVPELFFGAVQRGQRIQATSAAFGARKFEGSIETVDSRIDRVSRSFHVRAGIPNHDFALPAGMFMLVELTLAERQSLTVPEEAVMATDETASVFVIADGKAERREVALGQRELGLVEITDGLSVGERVAVSGLQRIRSGAPVRIAGEIKGGGQEGLDEAKGEPSA